MSAKYIQNCVFSSSNPSSKLSIGGAVGPGPGAGASEGIKSGMPLSSIFNPVVLSTILIGGEIRGKRIEGERSEGEKEYYIPGGLVVSSWEEEPRECVYTDPAEVPVMLEKWEELCDAVEVRPESNPKSRVSKKKRIPKKSNRKTK
jgi:hypothetical protein